MGKGLNHNSVEEMRFPFSKQVPFLWEAGRRAGAHSNPLPSNLGQWTDLLSPFDVNWVCPQLVKDLHLSCISRLERNEKPCGELPF